MNKSIKKLVSEYHRRKLYIRKRLKEFAALHKGKDEENLNDEYMVFRNSCTHPVDMTNWKITAERGSFIFPEFTLQPKKTVTLHTGSGTKNATDVYWGSAKPIWKNADDTLLAYNAEGQMVLDYTY